MAPKSRNKSDGNATQDDSYDGSSSYFQKTVCLQDWWLVKAEKEFEGRRLAVQGFINEQRTIENGFSSEASPVSDTRKGTQSILSPESLNLKRSRSGRVLYLQWNFGATKFRFMIRIVELLAFRKRWMTLNHQAPEFYAILSPSTPHGSSSSGVQLPIRFAKPLSHRPL
ncbi:hypothetical protein F3Y22_tig00117056pilonHSYRG01398 [Hibiscus syriacus]|uniref:SANTA domain-containing protein n=1 Tax=Hibiscus syriacus TaxID=106335 RepID=A0A6A2WA29_HIBSY|nr:hypothetical protein F3Y22_tig00117056pilonHSYRG01398 [Hibiscus syriacus]